MDAFRSLGIVNNNLGFLLEVVVSAMNSSTCDATLCVTKRVQVVAAAMRRTLTQPGLNPEERMKIFNVAQQGRVLIYKNNSR